MLQIKKEKYWTLEIEEVFKILHTKKTGLTEEDALKRLEFYGENDVEAKSKNTLIKILWSQVQSPLIFILIFASVLTFYLGETTETIVILLAVIINIIFGAIQEYAAENTVENLKKLLINKAMVLRGNQLRKINAKYLVPGDVIALNYGDRIPADALLIESVDLKVDEAILSGESIPVTKNLNKPKDDLLTNRHNYLFCGTLINNGNALAVVTVTGKHTEIGKIAQSLASTDKTKTPVQTAVDKISWYIFYVALGIVSLIFTLGIYRGEDFFSMIVLSSAVAVGAVPEALPIALTMILAKGILNVSKKGGLIRKLSSAETLGSTTLILTDKTGTLTEGKLTLTNTLSLNALLANTESSEEEKKNLIKLALHNNTATVEKIGDNKTDWVYNGNAFEVIILKIAHNLDINIENKNKLTLPFNSTNKYSISEDDKSKIILGAPDILLSKSNLSAEQKIKIETTIKTLSDNGNRLVAIATTSTVSTEIKDITLLGIFAFSDPIRPSTKEALTQIMSAGIKVKVISGDLPGTARFIARQVGIDASDEEILTGSEIKEMNDTELLEIIPQIKIFARVTPDDKLRIGRLYQSLGEITAMTGDGVNDAPALKSASIGISLASGSDVAKSAADMILISNDFNTIARCVKEGYNIKYNIQKVFVYLMSNSLDEVFVIAGSLIAGLALPLNALQIIWVNIVTGSLPALAFAYDRNRHIAIKPSGSIFDFRTKFLSIGIGTLSSAMLFGLYYLLTIYIKDTPLAQSIFFLCFATYILFVSYSFRDITNTINNYNPFTNTRLNLANALAFILIIFGAYNPFMQKVFSLEFIPYSYLWIVALWLIVNILLVEVSKLIIKKRYA